MSSTTANAQVIVSKQGPNGTPTAQVRVDPKITAAQLGSVLQHVTTNDRVLTAAGLRPCGACKSGLNINIIDGEQEIIQIGV